MTSLEISVQDPQGAAVAAACGADRIEVCSALALGGLTPSLGLISSVIAYPLPVHVLIRPRAGSFAYSEEEREVIEADVRHALAAGAAGVVFGALRGDAIDTDLMERVRGLSARAELTFHRAFDTLTDRVGAVDVLVGLGVDRVLTSGGATLAPDACEELALLVTASAGRLQIMAGSGIDADSVHRVLATGVDAVHASAKRVIPDPVSIGLGSMSPAGTGGRETTDPDIVRALRLALDEATAR